MHKPRPVSHVLTFCPDTNTVPYMQVDSPVNWSQDQVQQLQYAHLIHKVTEQHREWSSLYGKLLAEGLVDKAAPPSKQVGVVLCGSSQGVQLRLNHVSS